MRAGRIIVRLMKGDTAIRVRLLTTKGSAIVAVGVDVVRRGRIRALLERHGKRFAEVIFSHREMSELSENDMEGAERKFGFKEALLKTLGIGIGSGEALREIELLEAVTPPNVQVRGQVEKELSEVGAPMIAMWSDRTEERELVVTWLIPGESDGTLPKVLRSARDRESGAKESEGHN